MTTVIEKLVKEIGFVLKKRDAKLVTAESCTGGGLSYWITSVPGCTEWFDRGFVTYSDASKVELLGVNRATILSFGAVSEQTAREMAEGALRHSEASVSIAVTGIAGPTGGSTLKPVGTVWIAWAGRDFSTLAEVDLFSGDRHGIRMRVMERALEKLFHLLK
jgi:nicotinamide-nucleotide amidase